MPQFKGFSYPLTAYFGATVIQQAEFDQNGNFHYRYQDQYGTDQTAAVMQPCLK